MGARFRSHVSHRSHGRTHIIATSAPDEARSMLREASVPAPAQKVQAGFSGLSCRIGDGLQLPIWRGKGAVVADVDQMEAHCIRQEVEIHPLADMRHFNDFQRIG